MSSPMRWGAPPRGGSGGGGGSYHILGLFILRPVAWLIAAVIGMSAFGSLLDRAGIPVLRSSVLIVEPVWHGQVWRLVTWAVVELDPLGLIFGCLLLYFFAADLVGRWGTRRFFVNFFGGAALVGAVTCVIGRYVWDDVGKVVHTGLWPMEEAMIIAWATLFRDRQILLFFMLPIAGRNLIAITIAITVVMGAMNGFHAFVPHFVAELAALLYMDVLSVRTLMLRGRLAWFERKYKRRTARLVRIDNDRDEPPRWTH